METTETSRQPSTDLDEKAFEKSHVPSDPTSPPSESNDETVVGAEGANAEASPSPRNMSQLKWILVLAAIYMSALLYGLDTTIVADVQGTVIERFGQAQKLAWLGVGFPLGSIAIILSLGKAFGIFNVKYLFISCLVLFEGGSALCAGAPSMNALIIGRVIAGAGGAGMYIGALNITTILTSVSERPLYIALIGAFWGLGTILGPVVGGGFSESSATWRWAFYINLVLFAPLAPICLFLLPSLDPQPDRTLVDKLSQMDWVGAVLNAGIYACWVLALTFGGAEWAWSDGRTITCFVVCGVLIIAFALQQGFTIFTDKQQRIFPGGFLRSRTLLLQYLGTSCMATVIFVTLYYIPIFFQFTRGDSALKAAVRLLPFICIMIFSIMFNGALMPKLGYYQPWHVASGIFATIGGALMFTVHADTSSSKVYGYSVLLAIGAGLTGQVGYSVAPAKVAVDSRYGPQMIPDALGFINMAQIGSIVHALAISGTVFQNLAFQYLKDAFKGSGFTDAQLHSAIAGQQSQFLQGASDEVRKLAVDAIIKAMDRVYILVIVAGATCLIGSVLMKREKVFIDGSHAGG